MKITDTHGPAADHFDYLDPEPACTARDIVNGVIDDLFGPRPQTHRKEA
jgi:hypothetical protein